MTILELAQKRVMLYTRAGWEPGQFVHAEGFLEEDGTVKGVRTCWCAAPINSLDPSAGDDLWMAYDGPEVADIIQGPKLPGSLFGSDIPMPILAMLGLLLEEHHHWEQIEEAVPGVPDYMVMPGMHG